MNLFGSGKSVDPAKLARDQASQESIEAGGLPLNAVDRLSEPANRAREGKPFFTSDLSPNELLLTMQCGFEPLGQHGESLLDEMEENLLFVLEVQVDRRG